MCNVVQNRMKIHLKIYVINCSTQMISMFFSKTHLGLKQNTFLMWMYLKVSNNYKSEKLTSVKT